MLRQLYIRILNGIAINYNAGDLMKYLNFQVSKSNLKNTRKIAPDSFKIKNVVLSLKFREDRRTSIQNNFELLQIPFCFFDAIHGKTQKLKIRESIHLSPISERYLSPGSLGCLASHISMWKELIESGYDGYLIFEDDIIIHKTHSEIKELIQNIPVDFDIVYLGSGSHKSRINMKKISPNLLKPFSVRKGAFCYLISKKGVHKILEQINEIKITCGGIDTILGLLTMRNKIIAYHTYPSFCNVNIDSPSNIRNNSIPLKTLYKTEH